MRLESVSGKIVARHPLVFCPHKFLSLSKRKVDTAMEILLRYTPTSLHLDISTFDTSTYLPKWGCRMGE